MKYIGKEMSRVDGVAKVTGQAKYAAEFQVNNVAYGYIVQGSIAKGTIKSIDTSEAEKQSGVLKIYTHLNSVKSKDTDNSFTALQSDKIVFSDQPIALVVAETFEQARSAARLVKAEFTAEKHITETEKAPTVDSRSPKPRGNPQTAFQNSAVKIEAEYTIPIEHHNPMEPHAAIAMWNEDKLTIFNKTQGVYGVRDHLAKSFALRRKMFRSFRRLSAARSARH